MIDERTPFATATDFATYARRSLSAADTATVERHLAGVSRRIRNFCGWHIWPRHVDEVVRVEGTGGRLLVLPTLQLVSISSIVEDPDGDAPTTLDPTIYRTSPAGMVRLVTGGSWGSEFMPYDVAMTHGYDDNPDPPVNGSAAPEDLVELTCQVVGRAFMSPTGAIREQSGTVAITYSQTGPAASGGIALLRAEKDALGHYRTGD
jgi:hypothetical protein